MTDNFVANFEVDYQTTTGGDWITAFTYPEYIGGDNDPVMLTKQVKDGSGNPVSGASLEAYAIAAPNEAGPDVLLASGTTAPDGTIHMAPLNLSGVQQNPTYETPAPDDTIDIEIEYDACATGNDSSSNCSASPPTPDWQTATFPYMDADGNPTPSDVITEYFGTDYDAVLAQQQALTQAGHPVVSQSVSVQPVPLAGGNSPYVGTGQPTTTVTSRRRWTRQTEGNSTYQTSDNLTSTCPFSRREHRAATAAVGAAPRTKPAINSTVILTGR